MSQTSHIHPTTAPAHRFAVIGGDGRMTYLAERLSEAGYPVFLVGCGADCLPCEEYDGPIRLCATLQKATETATAIVLPLPATRDGKTVWCPRDPACTVTFDELTELLSRRPELCLFGGRLPNGFAARFAATPAPVPRVTDYYDSEALQLRNAYITAEAALMTAMELTDRTLQGASVAILGYGRIGKLLARLLLAVGAEVTVCARREESLLWAQTDGCHPLRLGVPDRAGGGMFPLCYGHTVIFNTIPARVLDRNLLLRMEPNTVLIDLASAPFGVSDEDVREAAEKNGLQYVRAPSLPGTYAPRDAGRIIADCVLDAVRQSARVIPEKGGQGI